MLCMTCLIPFIICVHAYKCMHTFIGGMLKLVHTSLGELIVHLFPTLWLMTSPWDLAVRYGAIIYITEICKHYDESGFLVFCVF